MSIARRRDGRYRARYRDESGKEHAKHFVRKADATRWEAAQKAAVARGDWIDPDRAGVTVGEVAAVWLRSKERLKPTTKQNYEVLWRLHLAPRWADTRLRAVTVSSVTEWVADLGARLSASWVRQALLCLRQILELAVRDGRLNSNAARHVQPPKLRRREPRFLTYDELTDLAAACGSAARQHEALVLLAGQTGLRWGELRALRVRHLDLLRCRLEVVENLPARHRATEVVTPKSHERRTVPFPKHLRELLEECIAGKGRHDLVFSTSTRQPLDLSNWRRQVLDPAVMRLGLSPLTPHDLRHTAASLAVRTGADVKVVQRMLGHASAAMTLDVYAGLFEDDLDQVATRLDAAALEARAHRSNGPQVGKGAPPDRSGLRRSAD